MSEPIRSRVRHHADATPTRPDDPTRIVLRRRRCGEPPAKRRARREGSGGAWRQALMAGTVLLAAGPVWALGEAVAERYHEEVAVFVQQARAHFDWAGLRAPEVATTRPVPPVAPAPERRGAGGTLARTIAPVWESHGPTGTPGVGASAPVSTPARPSAYHPANASLPAFASLAPQGMLPQASRSARSVVGPIPQVSGLSLLVDSTFSNTTPTGPAAYVGATYTVNSNQSYNSAYVGYKGIGTLTQTGGTLSLDNVLVLGYNPNADGIYVLNGGTLAATNVAGGFGPSTFHFNGGTLQATQNNAAFVEGLTTADVQSGGAKIDTNGSAVTVTQNLTSGTSSGTADGGLTKLGAGTLTLTGTNTYTGPTSVAAGTLAVTAGSVGVTGSPADLTVGGTGTGTSAATLNLSGGTLSASRAIIGNSSRMGVFNQTGGTFTTNGNQLIIGADDGTGTYTLSGVGSVLSAGQTVLGFRDDIQTNATGTFNLNGGTFRATQIVQNTGTGTFNFNGGTLQAAASNTGFMQGLTAANVQAGGAVIDTQAFNVTVAQSLVHDPALGTTADGGLAKNGAGTLTLTGNNTYTGTTAIYNGTLAVAGGTTGNAANPGAVYVGGSTGATVALALGGGTLNASTVYVGLGATGTVTQSGGTLNVGGGSLLVGATTTGTYNLNGGTARAGFVGPNQGGTGTFNFNGGTLQAGTSNTGFMEGFQAANVQAGGARIDTNGFDITIGQTLVHGAGLGSTADGGLTKTGAGTLTLGGAASNTYNGLTSVTGGTLVLAKTSGTRALGGDLAIGNAVNPGAAGSVVGREANPLQTGGLSNVTLYGDGVFDLNNQTDTIKSVTMTGGEFRTGSNSVFLVGDVTANASAASALFTSTTTSNNVGLQGNMHTFTVADGPATYDLDVQAGLTNGFLTKTGAGALRLAGATNSSLFVTLNAGTLAVGSDAALGGKSATFTLAGGTVAAAGGDRTVANPVALTGDATIGDSLDGTPRALTFTGATTLTGSRTLTVNNTAATTFSGPVNMGGNTLTMDGTGNTTVSGVVSGNAGGGLTKQGTGTLTLTANNTYSGTTVVSAGALMVNNTPVKAGDSGTGSGSVFVEPGAWLGGTGAIGGDVTVGSGPTITPPPLFHAQLVAAAGTLTPGVDGPGVLTVNGNLTLLSGASNLEIDLAGTDPGTGYDQVRVNGLLSLGGTLTLTLGSGFMPTPGEKFYLIAYTGSAGISGTFDGLGQGAIVEDNAGNEYVLNYTDSPGNGALGNDVSLTFVPEPGTWAMYGLGAAGLAAGMVAAASPRQRHAFNKVLTPLRGDPCFPSAARGTRSRGIACGNSSFPRSQVALGNGLVCEAGLRLDERGEKREVQLPGQVRSQVQLGNEGKATPGQPICR